MGIEPVSSVLGNFVNNTEKPLRYHRNDSVLAFWYYQQGVCGGGVSQIVCDQILVCLPSLISIFLEVCGMTHFLQIINIHPRVIFKDVVDLIIWSNYRISEKV